MNLVDSLIREGWLKTPRIIEAFRKVKRVDFLPAHLGGLEDLTDLAEINEALPIGYGQTISQPLVVAFMIEELQPQKGEKILDIGSGSGWTTALLAEIIAAQKERASPEGRGKEGKVIAIEIVPELLAFGKQNVERYNFVEKGITEFILGDGSKGYEKEAPFDKILASATAQKIPQAWREQIKIGGKIVAPLGNSIIVLERKSKTEFEEKEYPGFVFVPLVSKQ